MPFRAYLGILVMAFIALVPLFGHSVLLIVPGTDESAHASPAIVVFTVLLFPLLFFAKDKSLRLLEVIRVKLTALFKHKAFYIAIGYIIFLVLFFCLLAEHVILDL